MSTPFSKQAVAAAAGGASKPPAAPAASAPKQVPGEMNAAADCDLYRWVCASAHGPMVAAVARRERGQERAAGF